MIRMSATGFVLFETNLCPTVRAKVLFVLAFWHAERNYSKDNTKAT